MKHYVLTRMTDGTCEWCNKRGGNYTVSEIDAFRAMPAAKG